MDYQSVVDEVESWPLDERARLVEDLWDRLGAEGYGPDLTPELKAEIDQRIAEMESNPAGAWGQGAWGQAWFLVFRRASVVLPLKELGVKHGFWFSAEPAWCSRSRRKIPRRLRVEYEGPVCHGWRAGTFAPESRPIRHSFYNNEPRQS